MLRSSVCGQGNACTFVKGTISVRNTATQGAKNRAANKKIIFKN